MKRFWSFVADVHGLAPHVQLVDVERDVDWDCDKQEFVKATVTVPAVADDAMWTAFCNKWKLPHTETYELISNNLGRPSAFHSWLGLMLPQLKLLSN